MQLATVNVSLSALDATEVYQLVVVRGFRGEVDSESLPLRPTEEPRFLLAALLSRAQAHLINDAETVARV